MRDTLSIIASSTILPSSAPPHHHHYHRHCHNYFTTSSTTKINPKSTSTSKPQLTSNSPILSSSSWDNRQTLRYYTQLASKLVEDGRLENFILIIESVVASGVNASEFWSLLDAESVGNGILRVVSEGKVDSVVDIVFNGVKRLGIEPVQLVNGVVMESLRNECRELLKCGEVERLVSLIERLAEFQFPINKLVEPSAVLKVCIIKESHNAAIRYARVYPHAEILFCSIILEFGKKKDLVSALTAFEASKEASSSPNMHAYRTIIDVCGLCGDYLRSRAIYEELLICKATPNVYVFNSLMNVNARDLNYTLDVYKQMEKHGVTADITSHNILLKSSCLAAKVEVARDIYSEVRKLQSEGALKLDVFTYSTMIKVLADAKMWNLALEIKEDMVLSGVIPNRITWSSLISACANAGLIEQAIKLFEEMLQAGAQPNTQCFNILLHACTEACQYDRAFRLFQSWKETKFQEPITVDIHPNTEECMIADQMNKNYPVSTSYSHLTSRVPFKPTTSTYNILMKACGTDFHRAKALMDEMKTYGLSPNQISWSILIDICGGSGNVTGAMQILRSMNETGIRPDVITYTTAIKICVKNRKPKLAFSLLAEMKKYQIKPNSVTYNTILRVRSRYGSLQEVQQSLSVYQHMRKSGFKPNDYYLKQLIEEWCEGVIQNRNGKKALSASHKTDFGPKSMLIEKVAEHLQDNNIRSLLIDIRGLTKLEARLVILAVLRKIKEKYNAGHSIEEDMSIVLGHSRNRSGGVKEAVVRLLQNDLGFQVLSVGPSIEEQTGHEEVIDASGSPTRRPTVPQRLRVTRESLHQWLQRKLCASA